MFKTLFSSPKTTKGDVILTIATALAAAFKAVDTFRDYKNQENNK